MTDLLGIGASAINTYRAALGVVGENVANAETPGYARRSTTIGQTGATGGGSPFYRSAIVGGGSDATGVQRAWDQFKATDARSAMADDGRASAAATWLDAAEGAVDSSETGVGAKVTAVFTAANQLAADPTSATGRAQMLGALGDAAGAISGAATKLASVADGIGQAATGAVKDVNDDLAAFAKLNALMKGTPDGTEAKATLADQRDGLLDDLAGKVGIDATVASDGSVAVSLAGNGASLLAGTAASTVAVAIGADGRLGFSINDVAATPAGGTLAGLASAAGTVARSRAALDTIATNFATQLNDWNAAGRTAAGAAGQPLLSIGSNGAASLTLAATSGAAIAAASPDGTANGNLLVLADLRGSDGAEAQLAGLVGANGQALASAKSQALAAATRLGAATVARDDASGVSLDQEAAELVRFQQAYDGSAKIIQAAQTTLQAILALF